MTTRITIAMAFLASVSTAVPASAAPASHKATDAGASTQAEPSEGVEAPPPSSMLDVHVAGSIARSDALAAKIREDVVRVLRAHRLDLDAQDSTRLSIGVGGESYRYRISLGVMQGGSAAKGPEPFTCECTSEELLVQITQTVVDLVPVLKGEPAEPAATAPSSTDAPPVARQPADRPPHRAPLGGLGKGGVAALVVGGAFVIAGIGLVAAPQPDASDTGGLERDTSATSLRPAGYAMLATGGAALVVGAVLLGVDRRRAARRRTTVSPAFGARLTGFSLVTRF